MTYKGREKRGSGTPDVKDLAVGYLKLFLSTVAAVSFVAGIAWKAYAKDAIDSQITEQVKPIENKVDENTKSIKSLNSKLDSTQFDVKVTRKLIERIAGKKMVKEVLDDFEDVR